MLTLNLEHRELRELQRLIDMRLDEVSSEIHHAQLHDFKDQLRGQKALLLRMQAKLQNLLHPQPPAGAP